MTTTTTENLDGHTAAPLPVTGLTWSLRPWALRTVAVLELRQRVRGSRWYIVLGVWMVILAGLTWLVQLSVDASYVDSSLAGGVGPATDLVEAHAGQVMFSIVVLMVLSLGALITPALTATSVNGDRSAGVLATLQTTLLSPAEIVVGKLLAAWAVALALLVSATPFIVWALLRGGNNVARLLVVLGVLTLMLLVLCAIGLGWSAVAARSSISAVLTYLTVAFLGLGLPLLFAATFPLVNQVEKVQQIEQTGGGVKLGADGTPVVGADGNPIVDPVTCTTTATEINVAHTERNWWLLAASPYVVVADATPPVNDNLGGDALSGIRSGVREARLGPDLVRNYCNNDPAAQNKRAADRDALGISWPYGLAADLLIGLAFVVVAVRRLRTPTRTLPRGTRVA